MKKKVFVYLILVALLGFVTQTALAWDEGGGTDWWYINANYGGDYSTPPLVIELDGDSSSGQTFLIGDTIEITVDVAPYAASCAGYANEAYIEWLLEVSGLSGPDSTAGWDYDYSNSCAEIGNDTTLTISYTLTALGTHTVYASSYAAVAQYYSDVADEYIDATLTFDVVEVSIDIKPGSCPNSLNLGSKGVVPVAILTADGFDASTVDPATVEFAGAAPLRWALEDVDYDGDLDLIFHFKTIELVLDGSSTEATLTGETVGGVPFEATDSVNIVPVD